MRNQYQVNNDLISIDFNSSQSSDLFASESSQSQKQIDFRASRGDSQQSEQSDSQKRYDRVLSAMKDESGDCQWSMENAMKPKKSYEEKLLKPVPS